MIKELVSIVLSHDIEVIGLKQGDIGAVVHVYNGDSTFEVEFVNGKGDTIAVLTLTAEDVRLMKEHEILHVREIIPA